MSAIRWIINALAHLQLRERDSCPARKHKRSKSTVKPTANPRSPHGLAADAAQRERHRPQRRAGGTFDGFLCDGVEKPEYCENHPEIGVLLCENLMNRPAEIIVNRRTWRYYWHRVKNTALLPDWVASFLLRSAANRNRMAFSAKAGEIMRSDLTAGVFGEFPPSPYFRMIGETPWMLNCQLTAVDVVSIRPA